MSAPTRDDRWIETTAGRLSEALGDDMLGEGSGYSAAECAELAAALHDMSLEHEGTDLSPQQRCLFAMLRMQPNIGEAEALVIAGALPRLDLARLVLSSRAAADVLDISEVTLLRHREAGHIVPAVAHAGASGKRYSVSYWLHQLLYVLAYVRQRPPSGGPFTAWPEDIRL